MIASCAVSQGQGAKFLPPLSDEREREQEESESTVGGKLARLASE